MKDDEDGIIDLIFYCVGCNIVDILGMVGKFTPLPHFILKHCQWQIVIKYADSWSSRCWPHCHCIQFVKGTLGCSSFSWHQAFSSTRLVSTSKSCCSLVMWGKNNCVTLQIVEFLNLKVHSWVFMGIKIRAIVDALAHDKESVTTGYYIYLDRAAMTDKKKMHCIHLALLLKSTFLSFHFKLRKRIYSDTWPRLPVQTCSSSLPTPSSCQYNKIHLVEIYQFKWKYI